MTQNQLHSEKFTAAAAAYYLSYLSTASFNGRSKVTLKSSELQNFIRDNIFCTL